MTFNFPDNTLSSANEGQNSRWVYLFLVLHVVERDQIELVLNIAILVLLLIARLSEELPNIRPGCLKKK